jgi:uncharacterized protein YbaP (TraB family)
MQLQRWNPSTLVALALTTLLCCSACQASEQGLLYTISRYGEVRGYLLGTIHSDDPRLLNFSPEFTAALQSCDRFAMELVPNQPTLSRLMEYMNYQDGTTLLSRVGEERYNRLLEAVSGYQLGPEQLSTMKVWAAMMTHSPT